MLLLGLLVLMLAAPPPQAIGQSTDTQTLRLEAGWNLVSLRVQPADPSLDVLFDGYLDQIPMLKQERGEAYIPSQDVMEFTTWKTDEGYEVYAETAVEVDVTGTSLSPESTPVALDEGWNLIPYFPAQPQPVDSALSSVEQTLVRVENDEGDVYSPGRSIATLDSLRPGQGYKLHVSRPDTLVYESGDTSKDTIEARTLMDALSLQGLEVGQYVQVQGRDEPGDGGGGTFVVTSSACETDGATCFIFDEDLTQTTESFSGGIDGKSLSNGDVSWRDFEIRYGADPEDTIGMKHLHGHFLRVNDLIPTVNRKTGAITDGGGGGGRLTRLEEKAGYNNGGQFEVTYSYTTSDRRLKRTGVTNSVNPAWWGAPKADPNNPVEIDPYLRWAFTKAEQIKDNKGLNWAYVDIDGTYYYLHTVFRPGSVSLRGVGDLVDDSGMPTKYQDSYTRGMLRVLPGEALYYRKSGYDRWTDPDRTRAIEGMAGTFTRLSRTLRHADKLEDKAIKIDGNVRNNMQVFNSPGNYDAPFSHLQNSGSWTPFYTKAVGERRWTDGMPYHLTDVHVVDMGGSGYAYTGNTANLSIDFQTSNVNVRDARRNHLSYGLTGTIDNYTVEGQYWGAAVVFDDNTPGETTVTNMTIKNVERGQFPMNTAIGIRAAKDSGVVPLTFDNLTIDLSNVKDDGGYVSQFRYIGWKREGTVVQNSTFHTPENFKATPDIVSVNVPNDAFQEKVLFDNLTVKDHGVMPKLHSTNANFLHNIHFKNFTLEPVSGVGQDNSILPLKWKIGDPNPNFDKAYRNVYENFNWLRTYTASNTSHKAALRFKHTGSDGTLPHPMDVYFIGGELKNDTDNFMHVIQKTTRVMLNDFTFGMKQNDKYHTTLSPNGYEWFGRRGKAYLRNCTDQQGRPSDNSGTYTSGAGDEGNDYVLIATNLLSHAWGHSATVTSGNRTVQSVEVANSDGTTRTDPYQNQPYLRVNLDAAIQAGNTIDIDWEAHVTPKSRYQTTGLFIARDVGRYKQTSFSSGNGPFTVDLRGTASSQESGEKIIYTASSGDASVVTANVQSDDYTLELTEQGTGTATITVTGEIPGVGTTQTTFEVTIE